MIDFCTPVRPPPSLAWQCLTDCPATAVTGWLQLSVIKRWKWKSHTWYFHHKTPLRKCIDSNSQPEQFQLSGNIHSAWWTLWSEGGREGGRGGGWGGRTSLWHLSSLTDCSPLRSPCSPRRSRTCREASPPCRRRRTTPSPSWGRSCRTRPTSWRLSSSRSGWRCSWISQPRTPWWQHWLTCKVKIHLLLSFCCACSKMHPPR